MTACIVEGCGRGGQLRRGMCHACYEHWRRHGTTVRPQPVPVKACSIEDCERPSAARGMCPMHYQRWLSNEWLEAGRNTRTCPRCQSDFIVGLPSSTQVYCNKSCSAKGTKPPRPGALNPNWRGGKASHPLYLIYNEMIARSHRPTHKRYADYGGRGITVCERWRADFWTFVADMGKRPSGTMANGRAAWSLDRIDNDGPYSPENTRWADQYDQARNRRPQAPRDRDQHTGQYVSDVAS